MMGIDLAILKLVIHLQSTNLEMSVAELLFTEGLEARREYDAAMTQAIERSGRDLGWLFGTPQSSKQRLKYWDWGIGFSCRFQDLGCVFLAVLVGQLPPPTVNCEKEFEETHHFAHRPSGWVDCVEEFAKPSDPSN